MYLLRGQKTFPPQKAGSFFCCPHKLLLHIWSFLVTGTCKFLVIFQVFYTQILIWVCFGTKFQFGDPPPRPPFKSSWSVCVTRINQYVKTLFVEAALPCECAHLIWKLCGWLLLREHVLHSFALKPAQQATCIPSVGMPVNGGSPVSAKPNGALHSISPFDSSIGHVADIS